MFLNSLYSNSKLIRLWRHLDYKDKKISTVHPNFAHLTRPLTDFVIYLEIKNGPHTAFQNDCFIPKPHNLKMMSNDDYDLYLDGFKNN